jgi:hypothetical protein
MLGGSFEVENRALVSLTSSVVRVTRIPPGQSAAESVVIDVVGRINIEVVASAELDVSVLSPGLQVVDSVAVEGLGGESLSFEVTEGRSDSPFLSVGGFHHILSFPSLGAGEYTLRYIPVLPSSEDVAVIARVSTDSPIGATVFATKNEVAAGHPVVLTSAVLERELPIVDADVSVTLLNEFQVFGSLALLDNGLGGDALEGDGLYSGEYTPIEIGPYSVTADIRGLSLTGVPFERQVETAFEVFAEAGYLTGHVQDSGIDEDGDGLLESIALDVQADIKLAGHFRAFALLQTEAGDVVKESGGSDLQLGLQNIRVSFEAEHLRKLGQNGPYTIQRVNLVAYGDEGARTVHSVSDLGATNSYQLIELQRDPFVLGGIVLEEAVDDDLDGRIDRLRIGIEVDSSVEEEYSWSLELADSHLNGIDIDYASGPIKRGNNVLVVEFEGDRIGAYGVNGPYLVRNLSLYWSYYSKTYPSFYAMDVGETGPHFASTFEGFRSPVLPLQVEVNPGDPCNEVPILSKGVLPVVVYSDRDLNADLLDAAGVRFGPGEALEAHRKTHREDVDGDGDMDLMFHFRISDTGIECGDPAVSLKGLLVDGTPVLGTAPITVVQCK